MTFLKEVRRNVITDVMIGGCTNEAFNLASLHYGPCPRVIRGWVREFRRTGLFGPAVQNCDRRHIREGSVTQEDLARLKEMLIVDCSLYGDEMSAALENETGRYYSSRALCNALDRAGWPLSKIVYHAQERMTAERFAFRQLINSKFLGATLLFFAFLHEYTVHLNLQTFLSYDLSKKSFDVC